MSRQDWEHRKEQDLWSEDDQFLRSAWVQEVFEGNVQSGYWDWVAEQYFQSDPAVEAVCQIGWF